MNYLDIAGHDAFRYGGGLNGSSAEVYFFLRKWGAMTAREIVQRTGRSRRTVFRVLRRMSCLFDIVTGNRMPMVKRDGNLWYALDVDLDYIAQVVGTAGIGEKQRQRHRAERRAHHRALQLGRKLVHGDSVR